MSRLLEGIDFVTKELINTLGCDPSQQGYLQSLLNTIKTLMWFLKTVWGNIGLQ